MFTSLDDYFGVAQFYEVHKEIVAASLDDASNPNVKEEKSVYYEFTMGLEDHKHRFDTRSHTSLRSM